MLCFMRYEFGILEGERTIYGRYFWRDEDSSAPKRKFSREVVIVNLSKNNPVCKKKPWYRLSVEVARSGSCAPDIDIATWMDYVSYF